ncbi:hypothetical protein LCGC14_0718670 [marine sediment metagenome]|uniref:Uncharacterized protein n=1 Tax=marine sediment metagenome TaxID=412755 RepID=A0A0F9QY60_9ZZZZ
MHTTLTFHSFIISSNTKITHDYWDFISDPIIAGIIELESGKEYQTGYNGTHADYLGSSDIYYSHVNQLYSIPYTVGIELTGSHDLMNYSAREIITTQNLGQGSGKYLFYNLGLGQFSLMEKRETIPRSIPGYPFLLMGFVSLISIFLISKKVFK